MRRTALVIVVMGLTVLSAAGIVWAQQETETVLDGKVRAGDTIRIEASETIEEDLYLFGSSITVDADVPGDIVAFGSDVTIRGAVGGDVLAGAGTVRIDGNVEGDVRIGAGDINVDGNVSEDVMVGAGLLDVAGDVGGDILFGTGQTSITGNVDGSVVGETGLYSLDGTIAGTEEVTISEGTDFEPVRRAAWLRGISRFISIVLGAGVLFAWLRRPTRQSLDAVHAQPAASLLWGAVVWGGLAIGVVAGFLLAIALAIIFGFLTLGQLAGIGVFTGLLLSILCVFGLVVGTVIVGPAVAGTVLGELILQRQDDVPLLALGLGVAIIVAAAFIPVAGGLIGALAVLTGLGAVFLMLRGRRAGQDQSGNEPALA